MSTQQSPTAISDGHQSLPPPGNKCQVSQYKANYEHMRFGLSNDEQKNINRSNDTKTYSDNSHIISVTSKPHHVTSGLSNAQRTLPVLSKIKQNSSHTNSVYQTIPLVSEGQPKISDTSHVVQTLQHSSDFQQSIPEEQIIMINGQLTSVPVTLPEPVLNVASMQDSSTVPLVSNSMLAPVVTSHTTASHQKQSASTPWKFVALPHSNTELQYMVVLPKEEIKHNKTSSEITIKSIENVKSLLHVKDSTCYGNKSNLAKVEGKQIKQTARKSTKSRPTKHQSAASCDWVFVDTGILSAKTEASMTQNIEIASEASRIKGEAAGTSADVHLTLDETSSNINSFMQSQILTGPPEVINASNTLRSFKDISDSTKIRPPPPLKQVLFPQTKRKVTRVTCPPLTPIHKLTKLSPETSVNIDSHPVLQRQASSSLSESSSSYLTELQDQECSFSENVE